MPLPHDMPFLQMFDETLTTTLAHRSPCRAIQSDCTSDVAACMEQLQHNKKCGSGRHDERRVDDVAARTAGPRGHLLAGVDVDDVQRLHLLRRCAIGRPRQRERCRRQQPDGPISGTLCAPSPVNLPVKQARSVISPLSSCVGDRVCAVWLNTGGRLRVHTAASGSAERAHAHRELPPRKGRRC